MPLLVASGSRFDHMTLIAFPFSVKWFFTSIARIATQIQREQIKVYIFNIFTFTSYRLSQSI